MQKMPQSAERKPFTPEQSVAGPMNQETIISRLIGRVFTHTVVKIVKVYAGETGPVGFVDAVNLIQQMDGNNDGIPNVPMYKLPYFRLQGGANAVIIDPKVGDIGLASFAMRDISKVKEEKTEGPPPSRREYDVSDGLYIGGFLNGAPSQYIHFLESGVNIVATGQVTMDCTKLLVNAPIESSADITDNVASQSENMRSMRAIYNSHTHASGPPPNQDM